MTAPPAWTTKIGAYLEHLNVGDVANEDDFDFDFDDDFAIDYVEEWDENFDFPADVSAPAQFETE